MKKIIIGHLIISLLILFITLTACVQPKVDVNKNDSSPGTPSEPAVNCNLSSLLISSGSLTPDFDPTTDIYTVIVPNAVANITVTPTASDASHDKIEVRINSGIWSTVLSNTASGSLTLNVDANLIEIKVTGKDLVSTKIYTVTVTRYSNNADLVSLSLSSGTLLPVFDPLTTDYTASVTIETTSITVTPAADDPNHNNIEVRINSGSWSNVTSGTASGDLPLNFGENPIEVRVTAQDTLFSKTYTVMISRLLNDAGLLSLTISSGTLLPAFDTGVIAYTTDVANIAFITVTPFANDPNYFKIEVRINSGSWANVTSGTASGDLPLSIGANPVDVRVTAQDTVTSKTYTITVTNLNMPAVNPLIFYKFNTSAGTSNADVANNGTAVQSTITMKNTNLSPADMLSADAEGISGLPGDKSFANTTVLSGKGGIAECAIDDAAIDQLMSFTLIIWYKRTAPHTVSSRFFINGAEDINGFYTIFNTDNQIQFTIRDGSASDKIVAVNENGLELQNIWNFIAITYDGTQTSNNVKFYWGTKDTSVALYDTQSITAGGAVNDDLQPLQIGNRNSDLGRYLQAYIDNPRIYGNKSDASGALTLAELEALRIADKNATN